MADRRGDLRALVRLEVAPGRPRLKRPPFYVTHNISVSGMFLITSDPLPEKSRIRLKFELPGMRRKLEAVGEVVWCREQGERPPFFPGMGIRFLSIKENDRADIEKFILELLDQEKPAAAQKRRRKGG